MTAPTCPHCGKALALVESARFGKVTVHESPLCDVARKLQEQGPPTVAITFVFIGLVPPQGMPRCDRLWAAGSQCILPKGHRGMHRAGEGEHGGPA